jgi:hypothetical protein
MTYFAQVIAGRVTQVIVADQEFIDSGSAGTPSEWIQTSKIDDASVIRRNPASVNGHYDSEADAFYDAQPYASWTLDTSTYKWSAPVSYPGDGKNYRWDEATLTWIEIVPLL